MNHELPIAGHIETASSGRRRSVRAILKGTGMCTPIEPITVDRSGGQEFATPGRDRFHPSHPAVVSRPELFKPADSEDVATGNVLLRRLTLRKRAGKTVAVPDWASGRAQPRLPRSASQAWRLP